MSFTPSEATLMMSQNILHQPKHVRESAKLPDILSQKVINFFNRSYVFRCHHIFKGVLYTGKTKTQ